MYFLIVAHYFAYNVREPLLKDKKCGCFYCLEIFDPKEIKEWIADVSGTAVCPYCGIDSIVGEHSGFPIKKGFLRKMQQYWF